MEADGTVVLVCVYYRVAAADAARANAAVREFQRGLAARMPTMVAESLLRFDLTAPARPPDDPPASDDATLMETYRLPVSGAPGSPAAAAALGSFLHMLDAAAAPVAGLLRGSRHVELFAPCVS